MGWWRRVGSLRRLRGIKGIIIFSTLYSSRQAQLKNATSSSRRGLWSATRLAIKLYRIPRRRIWILWPRAAARCSMIGSAATVTRSRRVRIGNPFERGRLFGRLRMIAVKYKLWRAGKMRLLWVAACWIIAHRRSNRGPYRLEVCWILSRMGHLRMPETTIFQRMGLIAWTEIVKVNRIPWLFMPGT